MLVGVREDVSLFLPYTLASISSVAPCVTALPCLAFPCLALPCLALSCFVCLPLSPLALPCLPSPCLNLALFCLAFCRRHHGEKS